MMIMLSFLGMNTDINQATIQGVIVRDPVYKTVGANGTPLLSFTVLTQRTWADKNTGETKSTSAYHKIQSWRNLAEINSNILRVGTRVKVIGEISTRSWDDPTSGTKKYSTDITAQTIQVISQDNPVSGGGSSEAAPAIDINDLPF